MLLSTVFILAIAQGVLILAILALHGGELGKSGMYVRRNRRTFSVSALAAFALSLCSSLAPF
jgi:hypothetical protein